MKKNEYFKQFAQKHQRNLEEQIQKLWMDKVKMNAAYEAAQHQYKNASKKRGSFTGKNSVSPQQVKVDLRDQFKNFLDQYNYYRSKNPELFKPKKQVGNNFVKEELNFLHPLKVQRGREQESVLDNEENLRRLKA